MNANIELRHLRYFIAVAETSNFTRAAARLGVTQPSVSQQLKELEARLGTTLFARLGKEARLTEAGRAFRVRAERILRELEHACDTVGELAGLLTGHLDVGVVPALHLAWVPPVLARLAVEHPGISVAVHERSMQAVEKDVEAGKLDLGLALLTGASPRLARERLFVDELVLVVPKEHVLAARSSVAPRELTALEFVLLPEAYDLRRSVDQLFQRARLRPRVAFELDALDPLLRTVLATRRPTILPSSSLRGREDLGLVAVPFTPRTRSIPFGIVERADDARSPAAERFAAIVRDVATPARAKPPRSAPGRGSLRAGRAAARR
ncbi:MAG: LysR family transcriptional regulator [Planctomycetes bacterium]|nr:LysR family transcriptional regulator [Planctomycetota bacterium]